MRILNRKQFLALEGEQVYAKYRPQICEDLCIKLCSYGTNDFLVQCLSPELSLDDEGSADNMDKLHEMGHDASLDLPANYDYAGRDGCFDEDQLFLVLSKSDVLALIERLKRVVE